jgi:tRNA modification GTPase
MSPQDTIAAIATPLGEGGLGVVRVSGRESIAIVDRLFQPVNAGPLKDAASHACRVGLFGGAAPVDQVVVTVFRAPNSYTGEDVVEISCHGSPLILRGILDACVTAGARFAQAGEFTQRAFLSGKIDLAQAEAVAELIHAKSEKGRHAALAQLQGRLSTQVRSLRDRLLPLLAHIEVGLDHSDENHDFLAREQLVQGCASVRDAIDSIVASGRVAKVLRQGLRVALVGRPNVGKSSLLNALLKEERAIVTPIAGTTRDTLEESVQWDGIPVVLTDTAGLREEASDPVEALGMRRTRDAAAASDFVIGLFDGSQPLTDEDRHVIQAFAEKPHLWVVNKSDLPRTWAPETLSQLNGGGRVLPVSAKTGEGLNSLIAQVKDAALGESAPAGEASWLLNARHETALARAREALEGAVSAAQDDQFEECVALELRAALSALGEIIGETATEELLGQIFSQFCVGK